MGTSSEVSLAHHRDIFHYYVSLKTFSRWLAKIVTGQIRHELKRPEPSCWSYLLRNFTSWVQTCPMSCRGESVKMLTNQITFCRRQISTWKGTRLDRNWPIYHKLDLMICWTISFWDQEKRVRQGFGCSTAPITAADETRGQQRQRWYCKNVHKFFLCDSSSSKRLRTTFFGHS